MSVDALMAEIGKLDVEDQFEIARRIQDSADPAEAEAAISPELQARLEQRIAELDANPESAVPWNELMTRVRARL